MNDSVTAERAPGFDPVGAGFVLPDDAHNRALVANVHPRDWPTPVPTGRYNLVVIGAGTAGLVSAVGAAGLGAKVAIVERHLMGGDCLNFGCVPSKALLRAGRVARAVRDSGAFGVQVVGAVSFDFGIAMQRMRKLRAAISHHDSASRLAGLGIDVFLGEARFVAGDAMEVGGQRLEFARAVIATGARAAALEVPGLAEAGYLTNETVFSLTQLPRRLVVVGAGPIGCELAQAFRRFGSSVTIVSLDARVLPREDADASAVVAARLTREGVEMRLGARLIRVERRGGDKVLTCDRGQGPEEIACDEILVAVGRAPNIEGLGLNAAGIEHTRTGVSVDDHLRTTNRRVFAAGDVCSNYKFTHAADAMARIVIQNALFFGARKASALTIPWCTYTDPEVAHVGIGEDEALRRGLDVVTHTLALNDVDRAILDGDTEGFVRVHAERKSGQILGATAVAAHAGEMIGEMALAVTKGLDLAALSTTIHPYPTQSEAWRKLGDAHARTRLTPTVARILRALLRMRR